MDHMSHCLVTYLPLFYLHCATCFIKFNLQNAFLILQDRFSQNTHKQSDISSTLPEDKMEMVLPSHLTRLQNLYLPVSNLYVFNV